MNIDAGSTDSPACNNKGVVKISGFQHVLNTASATLQFHQHLYAPEARLGHARVTLVSLQGNEIEQLFHFDQLRTSMLRVVFAEENSEETFLGV